MAPDFIIFMLAGIAFGTFTGLVPGIHPNTVFLMLVSAPFLMAAFPGDMVLVFIISVAVSNTFTDFIPSILFGAPDPESVFSLLPGHSMLMEGRGHEAIGLTVIGGLGVACLTVLSLPVIIYLMPFIYTSIRPYMYILLMGVVAWMVLSEKGHGKLIGLLTLLASGALGIVTLNGFPSGSMIFPSLTGLFAISSMFASLGTTAKIPSQDFEGEFRGDHRAGILSGWAAGWFSGMLPGVGASQSGAIVSNIIGSRKEEFLSALGGINTSNILFTFIMLFLLGKTRSGAAWAISQFAWDIGLWVMVFLVITGLTVCFMSGFVTMRLSRLLLCKVPELDYRKVTMAVMFFLVVMVSLLSGFPGIVAMAAGAFIGTFTIRSGIRRSHMMGYLLVPTIIYFSGISAPVMLTLGF